MQTRYENKFAACQYKYIVNIKYAVNSKLTLQRWCSVIITNAHCNAKKQEQKHKAAVFKQAASTFINQNSCTRILKFLKKFDRESLNVKKTIFNWLALAVWMQQCGKYIRQLSKSKVNIQMNKKNSVGSLPPISNSLLLPLLLLLLLIFFTTVLKFLKW